MNKIEDFFDKLASSWDDGETHTLKEKTDLLDKVGIKENDKVIDIACGTGVITKLIHNYSKEEVLGIDLSNNMIEKAREKYKEEKWASFEHLDFFSLPDVPLYDVAIIYNAYPHFENPAKLRDKLALILKKGGKFAILHSLSRTQLDSHHSKTAHDVSRHLSDPETEALFFRKKFDIAEAGETDHSYFIIGTKKDT